MLSGSRWTLAVAVAFALAVALTPPAARAEDDEFDRYMTAASRLYENLEYERALEQLGRAKKVTRGMDDDIAVALYEGIILGDMGKKDDSVAAFKEALYLNIDAKLPVKVSPKVQRDFEAVRADVRREMAPILAKREAEKRAKDEEAARKAAEQKAQADAAARKAAEQKKADADAAARKAAEQKAQAAAAAARKAEENARSHDRAVAADAPTDTHLIGATRADVGTSSPGGLGPETGVSQTARVPVVPIVLGGVAVVAAGAGTFFGLQAQNEIDAAKSAQFRDQATPHLDNARGPALAANVLFAAAGTAAAGAVISWIVSSVGDSAPAPATATAAMP